MKHLAILILTILILQSCSSAPEPAEAPKEDPQAKAKTSEIGAGTKLDDVIKEDKILKKKPVADKDAIKTIDKKKAEGEKFIRGSAIDKKTDQKIFESPKKATEKESLPATFLPLGKSAEKKLIDPQIQIDSPKLNPHIPDVFLPRGRLKEIRELFVAIHVRRPVGDVSDVPILEDEPILEEARLPICGEDAPRRGCIPLDTIGGRHGADGEYTDTVCGRVTIKNASQAYLVGTSPYAYALSHLGSGVTYRHSNDLPHQFPGCDRNAFWREMHPQFNPVDEFNLRCGYLDLNDREGQERSVMERNDQFHVYDPMRGRYNFDDLSDNGALQTEINDWFRRASLEQDPRTLPPEEVIGGEYLYSLDIDQGPIEELDHKGKQVGITLDENGNFDGWFCSPLVPGLPDEEGDIADRYYINRFVVAAHGLAANKGGRGEDTIETAGDEAVIKTVEFKGHLAESKIANFGQEALNIGVEIRNVVSAYYTVSDLAGGAECNGAAQHELLAEAYDTENGRQQLPIHKMAINCDYNGENPTYRICGTDLLEREKCINQTRVVQDFPIDIVATPENGVMRFHFNIRGLPGADDNGEGGDVAADGPGGLDAPGVVIFPYEAIRVLPVEGERCGAVNNQQGLLFRDGPNPHLQGDLTIAGYGPDCYKAKLEVKRVGGEYETVRVQVFANLDAEPPVYRWTYDPTIGMGRENPSSLWMFVTPKLYVDIVSHGGGLTKNGNRGGQFTCHFHQHCSCGIFSDTCLHPILETTNNSWTLSIRNPSLDDGSPDVDIDCRAYYSYEDFSIPHREDINVETNLVPNGDIYQLFIDQYWGEDGPAGDALLGCKHSVTNRCTFTVRGLEHYGIEQEIILRPAGYTCSAPCGTSPKFGQC